MALDASELEAYRTQLTGHCYRMLGSPVDADDAVQETMVRAWKHLDRFDGRARLRTWLHRIATNVCLDALAAEQRRVRPIEDGPAGSVDAALDQLPHRHWLEPVPDHSVLPADGDPHQQAVLRQSIRLAFLAALQHLPPKQRAALLLHEVVGCSAAEVADCLDTTVAGVNSALQRARATLGERALRPAPPLSPLQLTLLDRYVDAFERYDTDALTALLTEEVVLSMPPYRLWLRGKASIRDWFLGRGCGCRGSRLLPVAACGSPAFAQYRDGGRAPWALIVLELDGDRIAAITSFLDTATLFPRFGLPLQLPR